MSSQHKTGEDGTTDAADPGFRTQLSQIGAALRQSGFRATVISLGIALIVIILATAYGQVALNRWNVPFYDAIQRRDLGGFLDQLKAFGLIAGALLLLNVTQTYVEKVISLTMRRGLTEDLIRQWLTDHRAYRLLISSHLGINPDQRLQEDARVLAEMSTALSIGFVQSGILLASFIGVLWTVSGDFSLQWNGDVIPLPGYMVWAAFLYAGLASAIIGLVGRRLAGLNAQRNAREADFRTALMRTSEHLGSIALAGGEAREREAIGTRLGAVLDILRRIIGAQLRLKWVSSGFGWLSHVAPIIIASPIYFAGGLSFGGLMMAVGAFNHVISALRWYMDNFANIAIWRAALIRVTSLRRALVALDLTPMPDDGILVERSPQDGIRIDNLVIPAHGEGPSATAGIRFAEGSLHVAPGERVLVTGHHGTNHKALFLALAGLDRRGSGRITLPASSRIFFMPEANYLPEATLRDAIAYPDPTPRGDDHRLVKSLNRVGLARLAGELDQSARWHRVLDGEDRVRFAFAQVLYRRPRTIVMEDLLEGLDPALASSLCDALLEEIRGSVIYIGHSHLFAEKSGARIATVLP